jgi:hypothetical protein
MLRWNFDHNLYNGVLHFKWQKILLHLPKTFNSCPTPFQLLNSCPLALMPFAHPTLARYLQHSKIHLQDLSPLGIPNSHPRPSNLYDYWFPSKTLDLPRLSTPPKTFTILQHYLINNHNPKQNFLHLFNYKNRCIDSI